MLRSGLPACSSSCVSVQMLKCINGQKSRDAAVRDEPKVTQHPEKLRYSGGAGLSRA